MKAASAEWKNSRETNNSRGTQTTPNQLYGSSLGLYQQTWGVNRKGGCGNKKASHIDIVTICEPPETLAGGIVNMATDKW
jgi:hypothetical protein